MFPYPLPARGAPVASYTDLPLAPGYTKKQKSFSSLRSKTSSLSLRKASTTSNASSPSLFRRPSMFSLGRKPSAVSTSSTKSLGQRLGGGLRRIWTRKSSTSSVASHDSVPAVDHEAAAKRQRERADEEAEEEYEIDTEERQMSSYWSTYLAGHAIIF